MIDIKRKLKNFGPLEVLVLSSITYVVVMYYGQPQLDQKFYKKQMIQNPITS